MHGLNRGGSAGPSMRPRYVLVMMATALGLSTVFLPASTGGGIVPEVRDTAPPTLIHAGPQGNFTLSAASTMPDPPSSGPTILNPSFESGLQSWATYGDCGWSPTSAWKNTGALSVEFSDTSGSAICQIFQDITVTSGQTVAVTAVANVASIANTTGMGVQLWLERGSTLLAYDTANNPGTKTLSVSAVMGGSGEARVSVRSTMATVGSFFTDDVYLNRPPVAAFTYTVSDRTVQVNGGTSSDPEGGALTYDWDWGDGTARGTGVTATHTYACGAYTYRVTLLVRDASGGTNSNGQDITLSQRDTDLDTLTDCDELTYGTDPADRDTDDDGIWDGDEFREWAAYGPTAYRTSYNRSRAGAINNLREYDADGDGLRDGLEFSPPSLIFGPCASIGGRNECPQPTVRDVYVQLNWMVGDHSDAPPATTVDDVRTEFADRSAGRPIVDQVMLHVYVGAAGDGNGATQHADFISFERTSSTTGPWDDAADWRDAYFPPNRLGIFRFALFAHRETGDTAAGRGEAFGDFHAIYRDTLTAKYAAFVDNVWLQELGHNLIGNRHTVCAGHDHGWNHNPRATNLGYMDF